MESKRNNHSFLRVFALVAAALLLMNACRNGQPGAGNLIPNSSFEAGNAGIPDSWTFACWDKGAGSLTTMDPLEGHNCISLESKAEGYSRWQAKVVLLPYSRYHFSGWIKTDSISGSTGGGAGFAIENIQLDAIHKYTGTQGWTEVSFDFNTKGDDSGLIECVLGLDGNASGRVYFDKLILQLIEKQAINPSIVVHDDSLKPPMSEYIYGQFIEHLGRCIYGGIWSEVIRDRKFYYMPGEDGSPWKVTGDPGYLKMTEKAYVGEHSPEIHTATGTQCTLYQDSVPVLKGIEYTGRIVASGALNKGSIRIILQWGRQDNEKESIEINFSGKNYARIPLSFHPSSTTEFARLSIEVSGGASCRIGTLSLMPANNLDGFRSDVIALLKELNSPVYRWPGGNFVSGYNWKDGIGDRDLRPPRKNPAWEGIESNDVGIDEFMRFCRILGTEPYVAINAGFGDASMAAEEVAYANAPPSSRMGQKRAANGHAEPYGVKFWSIGNEMYGSWQLGNMPLDKYIEKHNAIAASMKKVDPAIQLIAVGSVGKWDELMLSRCSEHMNLISEHIYRQEGPGGGLMTHVKQLADDIHRIGEAHRKYRKKIPGLAGKGIRIAMDEWNYWYGPEIFGQLGTRYFMRDGLGIAAGLNEFSRNSDIYFMANYAQTVNVIGCIKTTGTRSTFESTGLVLKLYRQYFGEIPVVTSGSPAPLDIAAALTKDHSKLTLAIINPSRDPQQLSWQFGNLRIKPEVKVYYIQNDNDMAYNDPDSPGVITIESKSLRQAGTRIRIEPVSVGIYVFDIEK